MKRALISISPDILSNLLQLPDESRIVGIEHNLQQGNFDFYIEGAGFELEQNAWVPSAKATINNLSIPIIKYDFEDQS